VGAEGVLVMAGLCAFLFPGLGHLILGKPFQALLWCVLIFAGYFAFIAPGVVLHIFSILSAAKAEKRATISAISQGVRSGQRRY
jgi:TM2 domain-containing membrane protein YozV